MAVFISRSLPSVVLRAISFLHSLKTSLVLLICENIIKSSGQINFYMKSSVSVLPTLCAKDLEKERAR